MLLGMAEVRDGAAELVEPGTPGAIECRAPGCTNWFVKRSGRHQYCKSADCTYRRGAPPAAELVSPAGAAEEVLRRLQESEEAEVGPALIAERVRALGESLQARDADAVYGASVDLSCASIWLAERAKRGELPAGPLSPPSPRTGASSQRPVGLVHAVVASHHRTYALGDQRVELIYKLHEQHAHLESTEKALDQTQGSPAEVEAREANRAARAQLEATERALQSIESAWRERGHSLRELAGAAAASTPPTPANGATT
jgi:hypothetical protein